VEKLRVVLANMPHILQQIVRDLIDQQRDMAVVGEVRTLDEVTAAVAALQGELVILTFSPSSTGEQVCCALREHYPTLTVVGLAVQHDRAVIWPPDAPPQPIALSAIAILGALRARLPVTRANATGGKRGERQSTRFKIQ